MHQFKTFDLRPKMAISIKLGRRLSSAILAGCLGISLLASNSYAEDRIRWVPDPDRGNIGSTLSGGRRGQNTVSCNAAANTTNLALMVPGNQSSLLTAIESPTLAWHIETDTPVQMTFYLSDPNQATPLYTQTFELDNSATVSMAFPKALKLEVDKRYRWTVSVLCPGEHQAEISARSFIERINGESLHLEGLSNTEQARMYAEQGIWYDAIAVLLSPESQRMTNAETMAQMLLEQSQNSAGINLSTVVHFSPL